MPSRRARKTRTGGDLVGFLDVFTRMIAGKQQGQVSGEFNGRAVTAYSLMEAGGDGLEGHTIEALWKTQPHLRTVVGFIARQMSQLSLKLYERDGENIIRVRDGNIAKLLNTPNSEDTFSELIYALVGEWALRDDSYLVLIGGELRVFPAAWLTLRKRNAFQVDGYDLTTKDGNVTELTKEQVFRFKGWTPSEPLTATSPVETLKLMLEEQHSARTFRKQVWKKGGRFGGYIKRPAGAPTWKNEDRGRFDRMWQAFTGNNGARAGDAPILEDGMEYMTTRVAAKEDQWLESVRASLEMCAQVYYVNPTMVGLLDNANFSNVREFRRSLYGDSLGPIVKKIEDRFNSFILPALGAPENQYVEFNVEAKLRGSFEEQAQVISTATGAPWQTVNEARKLFNLSPVDGGDDMVRPLNVLYGGQASPQDGGDGLKHLEPMLRKFIARQSEVVCSKRDAGTTDWWDPARWDRELTADLIKAGLPSYAATALAAAVNERAHAQYAAGAKALPHNILEVTP